MISSTLTNHQTRKFQKRIHFYDKYVIFIVTVRYDDRCNKGHNTFSITGEIGQDMFGCIHDKVVEHFPELAHLIKWHLCGADKPLFYIENTCYFVNQGALSLARKSAIWLDATDEELTAPNLNERLNDRLADLMKEFRKDVESLGFIW